jgi:hypothetical protein
MSRKGRPFHSGQLLAVLLAMTLASPAYAYIDPVTGSFLIQGLVAGVMAVMGGVRSIRQRIIGLFRRRRDGQV